MKLFYKNNGAISVFLSLILLPVMLVGGMTTDAARIYMSKVVISDAGEMAMNAGLAQYHAQLHDEYGLFVMEKTPEAMQAQLEGFFNASLNASGVSGGAGYDRILDLLAENFKAVNVAGSEIYRTEVEKQQILEYMKYRAPVCLAELVLDKLEQLKDTKKMMEAMEAEMDFSVAMEKCQDAFKKAKETLDELDAEMKSYPKQTEMETELEHTQRDYTTTVARCLLMRAAIQNYDEKSTSTDLEKMVKSYNAAAKKVDLSSANVYSKSTYDNYLSAQYYKNTIQKLGGVNKLLKEFDKEHKGDGEDAKEDNKKDKKELEKLIETYNKENKRLEDYLQTLLSIANHYVGEHYNNLHNYLEKTKKAEDLTKKALKQLKTVRQKLENAAKKFETWKTKTKALGSKAEDMEREIKDYEKFFAGDGEGGNNLEKLDILIYNLETNQKYYQEIKDILKEEKFFGQVIATTSAKSQMSKYMSEAQFMVKNQPADYDSLENIRTSSYITDYKHTTITSANRITSLEHDEFYKKLKEYCEEHTKDKKKEDEVNSKLDESKEAGAEANKEDDYPTYDWSSAGVTLPSSKAGSGGENPNSAVTDLNADGSVSKNRENVVNKYKDSIKAASSFLNNVETIVTNGIEGLYIVEYAMQMSSYYTINKVDGKARPESEIITLSGYPLKDRKAYRAECEYVLWGNASSKQNVKNTVMMIFGIRLLFNSFFAFTNQTINNTADGLAGAITGAAPYLKPIVKVIVKLGFAGIETANDIEKIKNGYGVTIIKDKSTWKTFATNGRSAGDNTAGVTFDYSEYLRVFLDMQILLRKENKMLGRIGDFIQVNTDTDITKNCYTMLSVQANVKVRTTFMRKAADWSHGSWGDDTYSVPYQSIMGY